MIRRSSLRGAGRAFAMGQLIVTVLSACSKPPAQATIPDRELDIRARTFVRYMAEGHPEAAVKMMDKTMTAVMPAAKVAETWQALEVQAGTFDSIAGTRFATEAGFRCVYVTCKFEVGAVDAKVVFDAAGRVSGLWFGPPQVETPSYRVPAYADATAYVEVECTVGFGQWELPGTITMPKGDGPFPAAILVHGSGPNDRDETVGPNKPFKDLASGLASNGIAVLRYEKRTRQYAAEMSSSAETLTVMEETIDDALAAAQLLRQTKGVDPDKIFVVGHSLGAYLAPRTAAVADSRGTALAGLVMLAPNARDLTDLIVDQVQYIAGLDGKTDDTEFSEIRKVKDDVARIRGGQMQKGEIVLGAAKAYWDDLLAYRPLETAKTLGVSMLVLQGERDYQVTMQDFGLWKEALGAKEGVTLKSFPNLNHLFIPGEGKSSPDEYQVPGNVDLAVIDAIAHFVKD